MNIVGKANKPLETTLFSKLKDVVPKEKQSNLVYNIKCECRRDYIGQTTQYLCTRIKQHINDGRNTRNKESKSAISQHIQDTGHLVSMENVSILGRENVWKKRNVLEMIKIRKNKFKDCLNLQNDTIMLPHIYDTFLKRPLK